VWKLLKDEFKAPGRRKAALESAKVRAEAKAEEDNLQFTHKDFLDESKSVVKTTTGTAKRRRKTSKKVEEYGKTRYIETEETFDAILSLYEIPHKMLAVSFNL